MHISSDVMTLLVDASHHLTRFVLDSIAVSAGPEVNEEIECDVLSNTSNNGFVAYFRAAMDSPATHVVLPASLTANLASEEEQPSDTA